jgi:hypothetical protein
MAEVADFVASIAQITSTGIRLSSVLYDSAGGAARAEQHVADIADHVKSAAIGLDGVSRIIAQEEGAHDVSQTALSEAAELAKRCDTVFGDVQDFIDKRDKPGQDDSKPSQPKEHRIELLRRRLDSLKHSILLLLHVLQLASAQAKQNVDDSLIAQERDSIRDLHQRQQDSLKALQALETNLGDVFFSDDETLNGSAAPSRVPTINFLVHSSARAVSSDDKASELVRSTVQAPSALGDKPKSPGTDNSDETVTDDDENLTISDLTHCANHMQKLMQRIVALQDSCDLQRDPRPLHKVQKSYRRFCRKFDAAMAAHDSATATVAPLPNIQSPYQHNQRVQPHGATRDSHPPTQHSPRGLPDSSSAVADQATHGQTHTQVQQNNTRTFRPAVEAQSTPVAPAWTISSEPLGPGSRQRLPPIISSVPAVSCASQSSPTNEVMSPNDDQDARYSGTDGDGDHGSHENGPVVYTKTGRISKAKKGLKVHICEECGRSFTRAEHLRRHQKNHGPNQVRCELCGKVFFRADLLQRHLERHKDLPQSYRFSNAASDPGSASPVAADDQYHRHIMPASGSATHAIPPHQSPGDMSVHSSGASGAPSPSEAPAASPAVASRAHPAWDTARTQSAVSLPPEETASQRPQAWQTVNTQERRQFETAHAHTPSPSLLQSHPGLPKLQPKTDTANGASTHKRYSNILPAPGAANTQNQLGAHPQEHIPNMLSAHHQVPPFQTVVKATAGSAVPHDPLQTTQGQLAPASRPSSVRQDAHVVSYSPVTSTASESALAAYSEQGYSSRSVPANPPGHAPNTTIGSGKISSDREGVNWRLAETDAQPYRKRKQHRTVSQTDADSSGIDERGSGHLVHRTPDILDRSRSGSRSLSLVMPQDDRDHALLGAGRPENRQLVELMSPLGAPARTSSMAEERSISRPSTGISEPANVQAVRTTSGPGSPQPESPYSLATINRYIQNQGPQPGVPDGNTEPVSPQISISPCERCSEYSIKCDGKLPACTACATTKYAGECSFASMSAHSAHLVAANTVLSGKFYQNMSSMTRHAMAEPSAQLLQPPLAGNLQRGQEYNSEEELPSPYLKPRDKGRPTGHIPRTSLDADYETQASRKRKADGAQHDGVEGSAAHERKRSKGEHAETAKGKDIVDRLLKEWTVPVS